MFHANAELPAQMTTDLSAPAKLGVALDLPRILRGIQARQRWIWIMSAVTLAAGLLLVPRFAHREFQSQVSIVWEPPATGASEDESRTLRTLVDSVKLPLNLAAVRVQLALKNTLEQIGRKIEVNSSEETRLIVLVGTDDSALGAQRLAQTMADVFLNHRRSLERSRLQERLQTLDLSVGEAQSTLAVVRERYDQFRDLHHIANLPAEQLAAIEHAARLRADVDVTRAEAEGESARETALRTAARSQTPFTVLSENEQLLGAQRLADTEGALAVARARLTQEHPALQALQAQAVSLRAQGESPVRTGRILGRNPHWDAYTASAANASAVGSLLRRREIILRESLQTTSLRVHELASLDGEAATLLASVTVAERHLAELLSSQSNARDAMRSPSTGLRVLAAAVAPDRPSKSHRRLLILVSPLLGAILTLVVLLLKSLDRLRMHTAEEIAFWLAAPVLAASEWPADPSAKDLLCEDLLAAIERCDARTLVVCSNEGVRSSVEKLLPSLQPKVSQIETRGHPNSLLVWSETLVGAGLRRATRDAKRVLLVVESGSLSILELRELRQRVSGCPAIACVVLSAGPTLAYSVDRVGASEDFILGAEKQHPQPTTGRTPQRKESLPNE